MPSMYSEPWAKFTIRVTPKISDRPTAMRKSVDALASPFRNWMKTDAMGDCCAGNHRGRLRAPVRRLVRDDALSPAARSCLISSSEGSNFAPST